MNFFFYILLPINFLLVMSKSEVLDFYAIQEYLQKSSLLLLSFFEVTKPLSYYSYYAYYFMHI